MANMIEDTQEQLPFRYIHSWHYDMLINQERSYFYNQMIKDHCKDKVVLEIGTGSGLMAALAIKHGAKQVICCEENPLLAMAAQTFFRRLGIEDKITLFTQNSKSIGTHEIPPVDVVLHELFGSDPFGEEVVPTLSDAKRFMKAEAIFLPEKIQLMYRPILQRGLPEKIFFEEFHLREMELLLSQVHPGLRNKEPDQLSDGISSTSYFLPEVSMKELTQTPYQYTENNPKLVDVDAVEVTYLIVHQGKKLQAAQFNNETTRVHWYPLVFLKLDVPSGQLRFSTKDNVKLMVL